MSDKLQPVIFLKEYLPYSPGERAGFPTSTAEMLLKKGIAEWCDEEGNITRRPDYDSAPVQMLQGPQPTAPVVTSAGSANSVEAAMDVAATQGEQINPPAPPVQAGEGAPAKEDLGIPPLARDAASQNTDGSPVVSSEQAPVKPVDGSVAPNDEVGKDIETGSASTVPTGVKLAVAEDQKVEASPTALPPTDDQLPPADEHDPLGDESPDTGTKGRKKK
jgi:hypothetical protein